jgi:hypothetical protein
MREMWRARQDSNLRPLAPEARDIDENAQHWYRLATLVALSRGGEHEPVTVLLEDRDRTRVGVSASRGEAPRLGYTPAVRPPVYAVALLVAGVWLTLFAVLFWVHYSNNRIQEAPRVVGDA